eukprot:jgi/Galph1/2560/GphlegSOOS_G1194.1
MSTLLNVAIPHKEELPAGADPYEEFDFVPYFQELKSEEELRNTWRVFTKVKDVLDNGRRLENASWRLWFRERTKGQESGDRSLLSDLEKYELDVSESLKKAEAETERMVGDIFGPDSSTMETETQRQQERQEAERVRKLLELKEKYEWSSEQVDNILQWIHEEVLASEQVKTPSYEILPHSYEEALRLIQSSGIFLRKKCAAFAHSFERNGANNFLLYLVRELKDILEFYVYSPKEGPMLEDFQSIGAVPGTFDPQDKNNLQTILSNFDCCLANTIMQAPVILAAAEMKIRNVWVIHEAWPKDQIEYYCKEVFLMKHLNADIIIEAFSKANKIVFPAKVQENCYEDLIESSQASVIYNGIPLTAINAFRATQSRQKTRTELGFTSNDIVLLHMGTVCKRKGQLVTAKAFSLLKNDPEAQTMQRNLKLLIVGARYIRQHEIEYIDAIKKELESSGTMDDVRILDVQKNVLPFYHAADVVLCPSLNEVLPLVICEAMAFEKPVVATRIDGIPEALTDGEEGFLISPGDPQALYSALKKLLLTPDLIWKMGKKGRDRVLRQFSFRTMANQYRTLFRECLEK